MRIEKQKRGNKNITRSRTRDMLVIGYGSSRKRTVMLYQSMTSNCRKINKDALTT